MQLLFNKELTGTHELRQHLSHLFASNDFDGIKPELIVATMQTAKVVSQDVYNIALAHYQSANYQKESPTAEEQKLDELVHLMQLPIALQAYLFWAPVHDLVHDDSGRRQRIDEHSKAAYQWQADAEDAQINMRLGIALDALIVFLDENKTQFTAWATSDQYNALQALLVNTVDEWQMVHPIGNSRHTLQMLVPFAMQVQQSEIAPAISTNTYNVIVEKRKTAPQTLTSHETEIINRSRTPIVLLSMAMALQRLPVSTLPEGLAQVYSGDRGSTKSRQVPNINDRTMAATALHTQGMAALAKLQQYMQHYDAQQNQTDYPTAPRSYAGKKFFRT